MAEVSQLILSGEEFNLDEIDGKAALFHAAKNNLPVVIKRLYHKGLDLNITIDKGKSAVFYANENHSMNAICELIGYGAYFNLEEIDGKAALIHAAENDLDEVIWKLFSKGLDLNTTDDEGKTAVFYANKKRSMDALCELIRRQATFNLDEIDGKAVLFHAAEYDLPVVIKHLYHKGLDLNTADDEGKTAMFYANKKRSMDALCELIRKWARFNLDEIDGKAVLFYAAEYDLDDVLGRLYTEGLDFNITDEEGITAMFYANKNHSMDVLCALIGYGVEFNLDEIDRKALLFYAAENNLPEIIEELSDKDLDLNITDEEGNTAMFYANKNHRMDVLCALIGGGAEFNLDEIDAKALSFHAAKNNLPMVICKLSYKGLDLNITDDEGKTAVFDANEDRSMNARLISFGELIVKYAKHNLDEIDGKAALFHAAKYDEPAVIRLLSYKDLDLNITDEEGNTAVFYANKNHSMDVLCELIGCGAEFGLDKIDGKAALFHAAKRGVMPGVIRKLFHKGLDLNITDDEGKTAVFYAAKSNLANVIRELHEEGLDLNKRDNEGKTAMFYANENQSMEALCQLIGCDAEFNLDEIEGKALLFYAAESESMLGVIRRLYDKGLDLNITDEEGKTAVFYAAEDDLADVITQLHEVGLDINKTDEKGKTALFYANENHSMDALCELIRLKVEFNLDEIDGKAALFHAAKNGLADVIRKLHEAGLDLNTADDEGKTVLFYADKDFMDALMAVAEVFINARDLYGRTPLFYALADDTTEKARYLIEKGGNLQLKDNCNVSIFSFFIENYISRNVEALQLFISQLFQEQQQLKALALAILEIIYCQAPLLAFCGLPKSCMIFNKASVLKALAFVRDQYSNQEADKVEVIDNISSKMKENKIDVPLILSLLNKLGANPSAADSNGNTALHYATLLPLFGVTQEAAMDICKILRKFGAKFDVKNHQRESPLQLCLSSRAWEFAIENDKWQSSISGLIEVCRFLLSNGCIRTINDTSQNGESIFHRIIVLIQQSHEVNDEASRKVLSKVLIEVLKLLPPKKEAVKNAVNNIDTQLNSPLHLWASIALESPQDYTNCETEDDNLEDTLHIILQHLLECGAKLNPRNANEETPLHLCETWTAVKLLLDAGANPNVLDSSGRSPLLVAAKDNNFLTKPDHFYPDVKEDSEPFWRSVLEKRLDPWTDDKQGESVLSVLIKSEAFTLANALVKAACQEGNATNDIKLSFLNAICRDKSRRTHWKTILIEIILESASKSQLSLESPLRLCCKNIVQFGMFDENPEQQNTKDEPSNDDGQPPSKKRRKDESLKKEEEKEESNEEQVTYDSVHCKIAKQLLSHGEESLGESCLDIAEASSPLENLLTEPLEIDSIPIRIPWTSVSHKHQGILAKVARRQECEIVDQISVWYHKKHIGSGSFGSIFAGINEKDGREVAMKRIEKLRMDRPEDKREIQNLTTLADCEQVVRYVSFYDKDKDFAYIVLELMEGSLEEYLNGSTTDAPQATLLCKDVVMGLKFLHELKILHRDLKPQNILYKVHPKLCLKIADFGLSRRILDSMSSTVYGTNAGTRCWIAPEVLKSTKFFEAASDMFSCGLILHYILSGRKHPFNPADFASKSEMQVAHKTEVNIMEGKMKGWDDSLAPEATHLVKRMLESNVKNRPSAEEALEHPLFWSNEKKMDFLKAVGNQQEFECPLSKKTSPLTPVEKELKNNFSTIAKHGSWSGSRYKHVPAIYKGMTTGKGRKFYDTSSAVELVRFIRNVYEHYREKTFVSVTSATPVTPIPIKQLLFDDFVFLEYFPDLVMEVYKAVTTHGWDQTRDDVKYAMNRK